MIAAERTADLVGLLAPAPHALRSDLPCLSRDPDLFFAESTASVEAAKSLCRECPVRAECLAGALERGEPWGVWGGEVFVEGVVVPFKRGRGRPRGSKTRNRAPSLTSHEGAA